MCLQRIVGNFFEPRKASVLWFSMSILVAMFFSAIIVYIFVYKNTLGIQFLVLIIISFILVQFLFYYFLSAKSIRILECSAKLLKRKAEELNFQQYLYQDEDIYSALLNLDDILKAMYKSVNEDYKKELLERQAQFSALQSQINPHFLYNTLDSIRGQAILEGSESIAEMIEALSAFFRYNISQKGDFVTLREELKNVDNYFFIQKYRFDNRFKLTVKIEDDGALDYLLPKMTIQPIVENSIFHGLEPKIGNGKIKIRIILTDKRMIININDDGIGMDKDTRKEIIRRMNQDTVLEKTGKRKSGIAIANVNRRIRLYFGPDYGLSLSSTVAIGTEVEIQIPLVVEEKSDFDGAYKDYEI